MLPSWSKPSSSPIWITVIASQEDSLLLPCCSIVYSQHNNQILLNMRYHVTPLLKVAPHFTQSKCSSSYNVIRGPIFSRPLSRTHSSPPIDLLAISKTGHVHSCLRSSLELSSCLDHSSPKYLHGQLLRLLGLPNCHLLSEPYLNPYFILFVFLKLKYSCCIICYMCTI